MAAPTEEGKHKYLLIVEGNSPKGERILTLKARNAGSALLMAQKQAIADPVRLYEDTTCLGRMQLCQGVWLLLGSEENTRSENTAPGYIGPEKDAPEKKGD